MTDLSFFKSDEQLVAGGAQSAISVDHVAKRYRRYRDRPQSIKRIVSGRERSRYDDFWALDDVSLEVPQGTTFGLIGHNGSGKSTLLRMMAGIQRPTTGSVKLNGRVSALLELGAGFHPELSGRENIYLNGSILGLSKRNIDKSVADIIEFSGLGDFIDTPVKVYSSGMYVRLGFAVAVHVDPEILIIDEVIAVGDEEFQRRCLDHLYKLRKAGVTIVIVTHSMGMVDTMCNQAAWLDHGKLMAVGPANEVTRKYLAMVNGKENQAIVADIERGSAEHDFVEGGSRHGSREIEITSYELLDVNDGPIPAATTGETLKVRIWYDAHEPITDPVFGIAIHHPNGTHLSGCNTRTHPLYCGTVIGKGHADITIDRLALGPGAYILSLGIADTEVLHNFDMWDQALDFHVQQGPLRLGYGAVEFFGKWNVTPS